MVVVVRDKSEIVSADMDPARLFFSFHLSALSAQTVVGILSAGLKRSHISCFNRIGRQQRAPLSPRTFPPVFRFMVNSKN